MSSIKFIIIFFFMTLLGAFAGLFLKRASTNSIGIKQLIFDYNLYVGGLLYLVSALMNIYILKFIEYSKILPMTAMTYVWVMIISYFFLKEKISKKKIIGIFLIFGGAFLIACF